MPYPQSIPPLSVYPVSTSHSKRKKRRKKRRHDLTRTADVGTQTKENAGSTESLLQGIQKRRRVKSESSEVKNEGAELKDEGGSIMNLQGMNCGQCSIRNMGPWANKGGGVGVAGGGARVGSVKKLRLSSYDTRVGGFKVDDVQLDIKAFPRTVCCDPMQTDIRESSDTETSRLVMDGDSRNDSEGGMLPKLCLDRKAVPGMKEADPQVSVGKKKDASVGSIAESDPSAILAATLSAPLPITFSTQEVGDSLQKDDTVSGASPAEYKPSPCLDGSSVNPRGSPSARNVREIWYKDVQITEISRAEVRESPIEHTDSILQLSSEESKGCVNIEPETLPEEPIFSFTLPGPGQHPWKNLTASQRLNQITEGPLHGVICSPYGSIETGPVYASIVDLSPSDALSVLCHWLISFMEYRSISEVSTSILTHTWRLLVFLLRGERELLEEIKSEFEYLDYIAPQIEAWEMMQVRKSELNKTLEEAWGEEWMNWCSCAAEELGISIHWTEGIMSRLAELAVAAGTAVSERQRAWKMVLNAVGAKKKNVVLVVDLVGIIEILQKGTPQTPLTCGCPFPLRDIVPTLPTPRKCGAMLPHAQAIALLTKIHTLLPTSNQDFSCLCHSHLRRLASGTFGLLNNGIVHHDLALRLHTVLAASNDLESHHKAYPSWFRKPLRPKETDEAQLGLYKYPVQNSRSNMHAFHPTPTMKGLSTFTFDRETVFSRFSGSAGKFCEFLQYGTVRIPGLFDHLDPSIITQEFAMYEHHFRPPLGTKPMGWLRIMYHSLAQQAIRQDLALYALHCAAREDGCWRFISYPYYTKSTSDREKTGFFHFDLNISEYLSSGKSAHVVQSAVTLVHDETPQGCTMLVPGFHKHVKDWWSRHPEAPRGGETTNIILGKTYTKADQRDFGPFIPYPCRAGETRITRPDIPHGSTPVSTTPRKVVFPWFIGIRDDHETLDVDTTETWSELAGYHRDMLACKKSTSGRSASAYGRPEGRWAAGRIVMGSTSCVGDALVGRRRWDDPEVLRERDLLLGDAGGDGGEEARRWVEEVRARMRREFERCWEVVRRVEREEFGEMAYFRDRE